MRVGYCQRYLLLEPWGVKHCLGPSRAFFLAAAAVGILWCYRRGRLGTLCGECAPGHSEPFGSKQCVQDEHCTQMATFWGLLLLIVEG
jgi:hypothetical protein